MKKKSVRSKASDRLFDVLDRGLGLARQWSSKAMNDASDFLAAESTKEFAHDFVMRAADVSVRALRTKELRSATLPKAQIIAHRGAWKQRGLTENTMPAFQSAVDCGCWGFEFDIRPTKDGNLVVHHDDSLLRTFGRDLKVSNLSQAHLKHEAPLIPLFRDVVESFGLKAHLMIELKGTSIEWTDLLILQLKSDLGKLVPGADFHLLSFDFDLLRLLSQSFPKSALVSVATTNTQTTSDVTLAEAWDGYTGHWLITTRDMIERHHSAQQKVGVGFCESPESLKREWARGVDWLFTNHGHEAPLWLQLIDTKRNEMNQSEKNP